MGCNQSSQQVQAGASPVASSGPASPAPKPKLVKYRTLLTGQTAFDGGSPSKVGSRANSRCTSKASLKSDESRAGSEAHQGVLSQGFVTDGSPRTDCSPMGRDTHFDPRMAAQAGAVTVEEMLYTTKLASIAYAGGDQSSLASQQFVRASVKAAVGEEGHQKSVDQLVKMLGLSLDRSFSHADSASMRGFIAYGESDLVLAYSGGLCDGEGEILDWAGTSEFSEVAEGSGYFGMLDCCSSCNTCSGLAPQAHEAYLAAFKASIPDVEAALMPRLRSKQKPVRLVITGHGVGGAIATAALAYILKKVDIASTPHTVLFASTGQPKLGDCILRNWLEGQITRLAASDKCKFARIVHDCDPVPAGPQGMPTLAHVGSPHVLTQEGGMLLGEEALGAVEVRAAELGAELQDMHQPAKYMKLLGMQSRQQPAAAK